MNDFLIFLVGIIGLFLADMMVTFIKKREIKRCNYDCSKCKNWDCWSSYCAEKRKENEK